MLPVAKISFNELGKMSLLDWCRSCEDDFRLEVYRNFKKPWEIAIYSTKQYSKLTPLEASIEGPYFATASR